jgi:hypothetical protein
MIDGVEPCDATLDDIQGRAGQSDLYLAIYLPNIQVGRQDLPATVILYESPLITR